MPNAPLQRLNEGWLQPFERPALQWLASRTPLWMTPDRLTWLGFGGAIICLVGYAWAAWNPVGLWLASAGLVVNWFGDSLDGNVARYRKIERPRYGYFLDNAIDVAQQFIVTVGVGLSGFIRWDLCFLGFSVFLMMSVLTLLRTSVSGIYQLSYGGIGPTEMRVVGMAMNALLFFVPPERLDGLGLPMTYPNILSLSWSIGCLGTFSLSLILQIRQLAIEDPPRQP